MNAVSTREASGSAAKASDAGTAMRSTSDPSSSSLKTLLRQRSCNRVRHQHSTSMIGRPAHESPRKRTHLMFMMNRWSPVFLGPHGNAGAGGRSSSAALSSSPFAAAAAAAGIATCFSAGTLVAAEASAAAAAAPCSSMLRPAGVVWLDALLARSSPIEQSAGASEGGDVAATVAEDAPVLIHLRAARAVPRLPLAYQEAITPISSCHRGNGKAGVSGAFTSRL